MAIRCRHFISFGEDTCRDTKKESSVLFVLSVCVRVCARVCMCVLGGGGLRVLLKDALQWDVGQDDTVAADCSLSAKPSKSLRVCFSVASGKPSALLLFIH